VCAEFGIRYPIRSLLIATVRLYQLLVSPVFPAGCRFIPSCSEYAHQALAMHGVFRGMGLTLWRILRCHPFARSGYDPVPEVRPAKAHTSHLSSKRTINP